MLSKTDAWQASSYWSLLAHQQAKFLPFNSAFAAATSFSFSAAIERYKTNACLLSATIKPRQFLSLPTLNGFPHFVVRSTFTVFSGIRQPLVRLSCILCGIIHLSLANPSIKRDATRPLCQTLGVTITAMYLSTSFKQRDNNGKQFTKQHLGNLHALMV